MKLSNRARAYYQNLRSSGDNLRSNGQATTESERPSASRDPIVRRMDFPFAAAGIPRYWMGGSVVGTAIANSLNLVFPDGERFFIRSVNHFIDDIDDPALRERVKRFYGQEGQHAREHERLFEVMREHGYDIDAFLIPYRKLAYQVLAPKFSPKLRLSITVALEHFTASFAEHVLRKGVLDELAPPVMAELLKWHAAEEIEHKDVAFDVLTRVDDSYALRVAGLFFATIALSGFWLHGIVALLRQEPNADVRQMASEYIGIRRNNLGPSSAMPLAFLQYLALDFHPSKVDNDALAFEYLESIGRRYA
jgi:predicted metal-dependent hydrolase